MDLSTWHVKEGCLTLTLSLNPRALERICPFSQSQITMRWLSSVPTDSRR